MSWTIRAKEAIAFGLCIKPIMKVKPDINSKLNSYLRRGWENWSKLFLFLSHLVPEESGVRKENWGGSPEDLAESVFWPYWFPFNFSFGPILTQNQNCIVGMDGSLSYLKSTSKSWAEKQRKMCPKASRPETRTYLFRFTQHESGYISFFPPYFTVIFFCHLERKVCLKM